MDFSFLTQINYWAVAASSAVFFLLGSFWFSTLFGSMWSKELEDHNVTIKKPTSSGLMSKMLVTFITNIVTCIALAGLVIATGSSTAISGLALGIVAALGFAVTTVASMFVWEDRSLKLYLIDIGYPVLGIIISAIILSIWQ